MATLTCGLDGSTGEEIIDEINRQGLLFRGNLWKASVTYQAGDIISYNAAVFIALVDSINEVPIDGATWFELAADAIAEIGGIPWVSGTQYIPNVIVGHASTAYICIQSTTTAVPGTDPAYWVVIASGEALSEHIADVANPHSVTPAQLGLDPTLDADKPVSDATQLALDAKMDDSQADDYYLKSNFTDVSVGSADAAKGVLLDASGKVDVSMLAVQSFTYQASFTPAAGVEYPTITAEPFGSLWDVTGLGAGIGYTFVAGDLAGRTAYDGDFMLYGGSGWGLLVGVMDPNLYYRRDGVGSPLTGPFAGGGQQLTNIAPGTALGHGVEYDQFTSSQGTQDTLIAANTAKVGITTTQANDITANSAKVTGSDRVLQTEYDTEQGAQDTLIAANTAKDGITTEQAAAIGTNTAHGGAVDNPHSTTAAQVGAPAGSWVWDEPTSTLNITI